MNISPAWFQGFLLLLAIAQPSQRCDRTVNIGINHFNGGICKCLEWDVADGQQFSDLNSADQYADNADINPS